ncbi:AzlC family ABC transporter permease [Ancylobacter sp. A5.8]|uniref:AzlC family ABC transporter permease n=1 Tax=Ancylobacter gelatini TaxID=2919920 RepID=UPI001F4F0EB0|nr:AzlC family ABC transporter permease [Ancylobacter gelatini]MCJ8142437.1 AzlC family ABC transporter permease [Ancylobacter gelatini]
MDTPPSARGPATLTLAGAWRGARAMVPVFIPVFVFGAAFGVAAHAAGLEGWVAALMSALVFAGASQFAVLDLWQSPVPWVTILLATFAINSRHLLLGASIRPLTRGLSTWKRYLSMTLLSDLNWAALISAEARGERDLGYMVGGGVAMWVVWLSATVIGGAVGDFTLADLQRYGLDLVMAVFFATTLFGLRRKKIDDLPWLVAGLASLAAVWWLPANWHVLAGGLAGGVAGLIQYGRRP